MKVKMLSAFVTRHPETGRPTSINPGDVVDLPTEMARRFCTSRRPIAVAVDELPAEEDEDDGDLHKPKNDDGGNAGELPADTESEVSTTEDDGTVDDPEFEKLVDSVESETETKASSEETEAIEADTDDQPEILKLEVSEKIHELLVANNKLSIADVEAVEDLASLDGIGKTYAAQIKTALEKYKANN